jgi:hypothetical protein
MVEQFNCNFGKEMVQIAQFSAMWQVYNNNVYFASRLENGYSTKKKPV